MMGLGIAQDVGSLNSSAKSFVSRASTATYIDANGVLQTAGVNVPRYQNGVLLVEGAATNYVLNSDAIDSWSQFTENGSAFTTEIITDPVKGRVVRITKTAGPDAARVGFYEVLAGLSGDVYSTQIQAKINVAGTVCQGTYCDAQKVGGGLVTLAPYVTSDVGVWSQVSGTISGALAGGASFYAAMMSGPVGSSVDVCRPQLELSADISSYIPTTGAPATRAADVVAFV